MAQSDDFGFVERPTSIFDLIDFPHHEFSFPFPGWQREFAPYKWFYIKGIAQFLDFLNARSFAPFAISSVSKYINEAIEAVPEKWKDELVSSSWHELSNRQLYEALSAMPVRLDKALLSILAIESMFISNIEIKYYLYHRISILPAIFVIDGITNKSYVTINMLRDVAVKTNTSLVFARSVLLYGTPITYHNAHIIYEYLSSSRAFPHIEIRMLYNRTDSGRLREKHPTVGERVEWF